MRTAAGRSGQEEGLDRGRGLGANRGHCGRAGCIEAHDSSNVTGAHSSDKPIEARPRLESGGFPRWQVTSRARMSKL